jgi:hypothetical protein
MREVAKKPWGNTVLFAIFLILYIFIFQSYVRRARMTPEQYSQPALETFESELAVSLPPVDEEGRKKLDARRSQVLSDAEARHKEKMRWSLFWVVSFGGALLLDAAILVRKWFVIKDRSTEPPVAASPDI